MDRAERRIEKALAELGNEYRPPAGWEARVLAATRRPRRRRRWVAAGAIVAAAAALILWWVLPGWRSPSIQLDPILSAVTMRGERRVAGMKATVVGRHRAVWVYRDDELVFACPHAAHCSNKGDVMTATVSFDLPGHYVVVGLADDDPLPSPSGNYDKDYAAVAGSGVPHKKVDWTVR